MSKHRLTTLSTPNSVDLDFICFPYGGGSPHEFTEWSQYLPPGVRFRVALYPGTGMRMGEPLRQDVHNLVEDFLPEISQVKGKLVLFGHSMGALTAFELARALQEMGRPPVHLMVSGLIAPHLPKSYDTVHNLPDAQFDNLLLEFGGMAEDLMKNPDFMALARPILRAAFQLWESYTYKKGPKLSCPITAFGGNRDHHYPCEQVRGWGWHTEGLFDYHTLDGDHFFLHQSRETLMGHVSRVLQNALIAN